MRIHLKSHAKAAAAVEKAALESIAVVYRGSSDDGHRYLVTISLYFQVLEKSNDQVFLSLPGYKLGK